MAFNEAQSLEPVCREIDHALRKLGHSYEMLIVDDGSTDGTGDRAERLAEELPKLRVIHHETNQGLGQVYRTGFDNAEGDWVTFFPADGQFPATILHRFAAAMQQADMVVGYLSDRRSSFFGRFLSAGERVVYRLLLGPVPRFQGIVMFKRSLLDEIELKSTGRGWAVLMELLIKVSRGSYQVVSLPTEMRPRVSGRSKVNNVRTIWSNFIQIVMLRRQL